MHQRQRGRPLGSASVSETVSPLPRAPSGGDPPPERTAPIEIIVIALGAVALGVVLRFVTRSPLWLDEALSVNIARLPLGDIPEALRHDGHPPLYYFMLHGWMQAFGTGDIAVRALSGVLAVVALPPVSYTHLTLPTIYSV